MNIEKHFQYGNKKLPKTTAIFNCGSATDCPSLKLGLCQAGGACYALKAEKQYPACKPYRDRQREILTNNTGGAIAMALLFANARKREKLTAFRFNESGDFASQDDVDKMTEACRIISSANISCYGYTARTDLDLSQLVKVAGVNVSNDRREWINKGCNRFKMVQEHSAKGIQCAGDCRECTLCQNVKGKTIEVLAH